MVNEFELRRSLFHVFYGIIIIMIAYYELLNLFWLTIILIFGFIISVFASLYRIPIINWFLEKFEREHVLPGWGALTFLAGSILSLLLFDKQIALAGIMILTIGDPVSHFVGESFGKIKHPLNDKKLLEGSIVGVILGFLGAILFVNPAAAFFGSFFGLCFEALEIKFRHIVLDDNLLIPVVSGFVMMLFYLV